MKKFIIRILVFVFLVIAIDRLIGWGMVEITDKIETGGMGVVNYVCDQSEDDILIFGSSRANHHYNAKMIEDSLGKSCFNCGKDGNGIILDYGQLIMYKERKNPKLILLDIMPSFDFETNDNHKYLSWLRPKFDRNGIDDIFNTIDSLETYKMLSHAYRFNSLGVKNLITYTTGISGSTGINGYLPLYGEFDSLQVQTANPEYHLVVDSLKLHFFNKFIEESETSKVIAIYSPIWYGTDTATTNYIADLCKQRNVKFLDFSNDPKYVHNNLYFKDGKHLNDLGADEFTKDLIKILKEDSVIQKAINQE